MELEEGGCQEAVESKPILDSMAKGFQRVDISDRRVVSNGESDPARVQARIRPIDQNDVSVCLLSSSRHRHRH